MPSRGEGLEIIDEHLQQSPFRGQALEDGLSPSRLTKRRCPGFSFENGNQGYPNLSFASIDKNWDYPDFLFILIKGNQDCPNLSFASIDKNWDC